MSDTFVHCHCHTDYSLLDGFCRIPDLVRAAKEQGAPAVAITDHGMLAGAAEFLGECAKVDIKPMIGCCLPGQLIYTEHGVKPIEEIFPGERVLTHRGRFRPVLRTMTREYAGTLYGIRAANCSEVWLTDEHPVLVTNQDGSNERWVRADELTSGRRTKARLGTNTWRTFVAFPRLRDENRELVESLNLLDYLDPEVYEARDGIIVRYVRRGKFDSATAKALPARVAVTADLAWFLGLFVAEGSFQRYPSEKPTAGKPTGVQLTLNLKTERPLAERVRKTVREIFGLEVAFDERPTHNTIDVRCGNVILAEVIEKLVGSGAHNKRVPDPVWSFPRAHQDAFLTGLVEGDGRTNEHGQVALKMASREVVHGARALAMASGFPGRAAAHLYSGHEHHIVRWSPVRAYARHGLSSDYVLLPLKEVRAREYRGPVHNLEVAEDSSYVTDFAVHNCEMYITTGSHLDHRPGAELDRAHLVLLAKDGEGFRNLLQLNSQAHLAGFYYKPRIDHELLERHHRGLICLSGCISGELAHFARTDEARALQTIEYYQGLFGEDYFVELQSHPGAEFGELKRKLLALAKKAGVGVVATNDVHYVRREDARYQSLLSRIAKEHAKEHAKEKESERAEVVVDDYFLKSTAEMAAEFRDVPEALANTLVIAGRIEPIALPKRVAVPLVPTLRGTTDDPLVTASHLLEQMATAGLQSRYGVPLPPPYVERLAYELGVIAETGFAAYVLLVADICRAAREAGIRCGPRGSAAGSLVCHGVGISEPDPLKHGLIFERFLNKDRIEMPDIDLDFQDDRRGEVFDYLVATYGADRVACVATYGTLGPKAALKDVGRVLGYDLRTIDALCRAVGEAKDFAEAADGAEFKRLLASDPALERLVAEAKPLAGTIRHSSTHAAGTVISAIPLAELAPLMRATGSERPQVQYPGDELQHAGLLKMDVLGLDNLTVLDRALRLIAERRGVALDVWGLPTDDLPTYQLLAQGRVHGVFQLGTSSGKRLTLEVKPSSLADLMALVALNRPGPLEFASQYAAVKNGNAPLASPHPAITEVVRETQGVILFQEQVIRIAREFAGFTYAEADVLRKAIGKKIADLLAKQKDKFVAGAVQASSVTAAEAAGVWEYFEPFARYGFSRSHACAYAYLTYQTAYLKAHYPLEFMCAVLDVARDRPEKVALGVAECLALGIEVLGPDVAHSDASFTIEGTSIRFGLAAVKGVGVEMARNLVAAAPYARFSEVVTQPASLPTKVALEALVKVGAFPFVTRAAQLEVLDRLVARGGSYRREIDSPQLSLFSPFDGFPEPNPAIPEVSADTLLSWERELCGVYVSDNPLKRAASARGVTLTSDVVVGTSVKLVGEVRRARELRSRRTNATFLGADLVDIAGELPLVCFPRVYGRLVADSPGILQDGALYELTGRIEEYNGELQLVLDDAVPWVDAPPAPRVAPAPAPAAVRLAVPAGADPALWLRIWSIASSRPGPVPLELTLARGDARVRRALLIGVSACAEIVELLASSDQARGA